MLQQARWARMACTRRILHRGLDDHVMGVGPTREASVARGRSCCLRSATRAEIEAEVRRCIDTVGPRSRFVLSTSCELLPRANPDCVRWFMEAAREYGRYERILGG